MKNNQVEELLKNTVAHKRIVNGYIFLGNGKTQNYKFAKKFAKMILCLEEKANDNCDCRSCLMFNDDNHSDFYEINKESSESIKIDEIRQMQEKVIEKPITSKKKVYIINNAENMTVEAQNCLLKTIEEPPEFVTMILVVGNENSILTTIKSRCTRISFTEEDKKDFTNEQESRYIELEKVFGNINNYLSIDLLNKYDVLYKDKDNAFENLEFINMIFMDKAKADVRYLDYIDVVEKTKAKLKANSNFDMCIDFLILNIWE